ncbi:MAG: 2-succinyl-5-enolpyruvyl-6-hydroxy-3-cyclohexene-1-carboxylic-acid synthase, partial [Kiritimatiellia bacterium]
MPVRIILLNNNGGGIFKFLPVAAESRHFEACFGTPHDLGDFRAMASQFDLGYARPESVADFKQALSEDGHMLIEVQTDRDENHRMHQKIQAMLRDVR